MTFTLLLNQMIKFFLIMALGYFLFKKNFTNIEFNKRLSRILLNITLPALILNSVLTQTDRPAAFSVFSVFLTAFLLYLLLPLAGIFAARFFPADEKQKNLYAFMTAYSNIGFMGFPIIDALYGSTAVLYTAIFNIMFNLSCYTLGTVIMTRNSETGARINPRHLISPGFLLSFASILIYFTNPLFPKALTDTISAVGGITTPLSMLLIGSTLATNSVKEIFSDRFLYFFTVFRQIFLPLVSLGLIHLLIKDELIRNVTCVMMLMPAANSCVMFANEHSADEKLASKSVFLTTLLSIITIPLGVLLLI
ncbi:MAG: AEC family transporter [Lachnospiraceae bacterium]|nr:AEC family transporter [Lachnospiraceae bacterium]